MSAPSSPVTLFPNTHARLGEVVETSTTAFVAESERLHDLPELGSLARVRGLREDETLYGVVAFGETGGLDAGRRAVKRGTRRSPTAPSTPSIRSWSTCCGRCSPARR